MHLSVDDMYTSKRQLPTLGQRGHSPQRHTTAYLNRFFVVVSCMVLVVARHKDLYLSLCLSVGYPSICLPT